MQPRSKRHRTAENDHGTSAGGKHFDQMIHHRGTEDAEGSSTHLTHEILGAAIHVHRCLGPGLLESAYETCLSRELTFRGIPFRRQVFLPLRYRGADIECGYRLDLIVADSIIVEIKAVSRIAPIHQAQMLTYLRLTSCRLGLIINFNVEVLHTGVRRIING